MESSIWQEELPGDGRRCGKGQPAVAPYEPHSLSPSPPSSTALAAAVAVAIAPPSPSLPTDHAGDIYRGQHYNLSQMSWGWSSGGYSHTRWLSWKVCSTGSAPLVQVEHAPAPAHAHAQFLDPELPERIATAHEVAEMGIRNSSEQHGITTRDCVSTTLLHSVLIRLPVPFWVLPHSDIVRWLRQHDLHPQWWEGWIQGADMPFQSARHQKPPPNKPPRTRRSVIDHYRGSQTGQSRSTNCV